MCLYSCLNSGGNCLPNLSLSKLRSQWFTSPKSWATASMQCMGHVVPSIASLYARLDSVSSGQPPRSALRSWSTAIRIRFTYVMLRLRASLPPHPPLVRLPWFRRPPRRLQAPISGHKVPGRAPWLPAARR